MAAPFTTYKLRLRPISSVSTPFHSDTFWGTICWGIFFMEGENKLKHFLSLYNERETVPLIVSDGFLDGYLPKPILEPLSLVASEEIVKKLSGDDDSMKRIDHIYRLKELNKITSLPVEYFRKNRSVLSQQKICSDFLNGEVIVPTLSENVFIQKTSIDRYSGKAMEGRLFLSNESFYDSIITFYLKLKENEHINGKWLRKILTYIELSGYGADKSIGKGQIRVESFEQKDDLPHHESPDAYLSLSTFAPDSNDPADGWYIPIFKYGKLGEHFASSSIDKVHVETNKPIGHNPFKRPITLFRAGATFRLEEKAEIQPFYGRMFNDIHWNKDIIHYGLAFPLGIRLEDIE